MNQPAEKPFEVPKNVTCPRCKQVIEFGQTVSPEGENRFRKGMILVCGECSLICQVGDSALIPLNLQQVKSLPVNMQAQLLAVCRKVAERVASKN
jgi:hypothetical protein